MFSTDSILGTWKMFKFEASRTPDVDRSGSKMASSSFQSLSPSRPTIKVIWMGTLFCQPQRWKMKRNNRLVVALLVFTVVELWHRTIFLVKENAASQDCSHRWPPVSSGPPSPPNYLAVFHFWREKKVSSFHVCEVWNRRMVILILNFVVENNFCFKGIWQRCRFN